MSSGSITLVDLPEEILSYIIELSATSPLKYSQFAELRTVSTTLRNLIDRNPHILALSPGNFRTTLEGPDGKLDRPKNLRRHLHVGSHVDNYAKNTEVLYTKVSPVLVCLHIAICPRAVPILCLPHPLLRQLIIGQLQDAEDGDGNDRDCEKWIPLPNSTTPWFPNLCSLHLLFPYNKIITALSTTPSLPQLKELCIVLSPNQLVSTYGPICTLLTRLAPSLETLTLSIQMGDIIQVPSVDITLPSLKELRLFYQGTNHPLPFKLVTPHLSTLIEFHFGSPPMLLHSKSETAKILLHGGNIFDIAYYNSLSGLEILCINQEHLGSIQEYLKGGNDRFPGLRTIVLLETDSESKAEFKRNNDSIITIIPATKYDGIGVLFQHYEWTCDACPQCSMWI